jgi:hypothetical protein
MDARAILTREARKITDENLNIIDPRIRDIYESLVRDIETYRESTVDDIVDIIDFMGESDIRSPLIALILLKMPISKFPGGASHKVMVLQDYADAIDTVMTQLPSPPPRSPSPLPLASRPPPRSPSLQPLASRPPPRSPSPQPLARIPSSMNRESRENMLARLREINSIALQALEETGASSSIPPIEIPPIEIHYTEACPVCFRDFIEKDMKMMAIKCGHLICNNCLPKITNCPLCRGSLRFSKRSKRRSKKRSKRNKNRN